MTTARGSLRKGGGLLANAIAAARTGERRGTPNAAVITCAPCTTAQKIPKAAYSDLGGGLVSMNLTAMRRTGHRAAAMPFMLFEIAPIVPASIVPCTWRSATL